MKLIINKEYGFGALTAIILPWLTGIVVANGFWSTFFAIFIPLYAYYLVIEHIITKYNLLQ